MTTCLCTHNAENTAITVQARRGEKAMTFPIEFSPPGRYETASMIAARKFWRARGRAIEPQDQIRVHRLERGNNYVTRVRGL